MLEEIFIVNKQFENFLEKKDKYIYAILKYVFDHETPMITYEELCEVVDLSALTLHDSIKELKEITRQLDTEDSLRIEIESPSCYHFYKTANFTVDYYFSFLLQRSQYYIILMSLFRGDQRTIEDFANKLFISKSSAIRKIHYLKENLLHFRLKMGKKDKKYILIGEEEKIRYFYFLLFKISRRNYFFPDEMKRISEDVKELYSDITQNTLENFLYFLYISKCRCNHGFYIRNNLEYFQVTNRLFSLEDFEKNIKRHFCISQYQENIVKNEMACLYFFISTDDLLTIETTLSVSSYLSPYILKNQYFILGNTIVYHVSKYFDIKFTPEEYFFLGANFYIMMKKNKIFYYYYLDNPPIDNPLERYVRAIFHKFAAYFEKETGHKLPLPVDYLQEILFEILSKKGSQITVMVYSTLGDRSKEIIEQKIANIASVPIVFVNRLDQKPRIVISDRYINLCKDISIFYINNYFFNSEISLASEFIEEIYFKGKVSELK